MLEEFEHSIKYSFEKKELLQLALTHSSVWSQADLSNERLEFLGDSVLSLSISEYLYRNYPEIPEGEMTLIRSLLVRSKTLTQIARDLGLEQYLRTGKSLKAEEELPGSVLSDALEALIGAIFLDSDYATARRFILEHFQDTIQKVIEMPQKTDYKALLQQYCHQQDKALPVYTLVKVTGPEHKSIFEVAVEINSEMVGYGVGRTKKEAEQEAAKGALDRFSSPEPASKEGLDEKKSEV